MKKHKLENFFGSSWPRYMKGSGGILVKNYVKYFERRGGNSIFRGSCNLRRGQIKNGIDVLDHPLENGLVQIIWSFHGRGRISIERTVVASYNINSHLVFEADLPPARDGSARALGRSRLKTKRSQFTGNGCDFTFPGTPTHRTANRGDRHNFFVKFRLNLGYNYQVSDGASATGSHGISMKILEQITNTLGISTSRSTSTVVPILGRAEIDCITDLKMRFPS